MVRELGIIDFLIIITMVATFLSVSIFMISFNLDWVEKNEKLSATLLMFASAIASVPILTFLIALVLSLI